MSFTPAKHGFHFRNRDIEWGVKVGIATPFGLIPLHTVKAGKQLCGGMVYAALDFFTGGRNIPKSTRPPALGTPLNDYITERQAAAHVGTVHRFGFRWTPRGKYDMAQEADAEIGKLRAAVAVSPIPMCIVRESSGHHLLAMGVTGDKSDVTIKAYDPGVPDVTCTITGNAKSGYVNNANKDSFLGFFVDDSYSRRTPLKIFASIGGGATVARHCSSKEGLTMARVLRADGTCRAASNGMSWTVPADPGNRVGSGVTPARASSGPVGTAPEFVRPGLVEAAAGTTTPIAGFM
jgi:hypothetical protein